MRVDKIHAVRRAIRMLDDPQQTIMWCKYVQEMEVSNIAEELAMTNRAVESQLYRGRKKLVEILPILLNPIYEAA